jgi:hypothetical protein
VIGNRRATDLLHLPRDVDLGTVLEDSRGFQVFRDGKELPPSERPLHRAARGEEVKDEILDIRFDNGERRKLLPPPTSPSGIAMKSISSCC